MFSTVLDFTLAVCFCGNGLDNETANTHELHLAYNHLFFMCCRYSICNQTYLPNLQTEDVVMLGIKPDNNILVAVTLVSLY